MIIKVNSEDLASMDRKQDSLSYYQLFHFLTTDPNGFDFIYAAKRKVIILNPEAANIRFTDKSTKDLTNECIETYKKRYNLMPDRMVVLENE